MADDPFDISAWLSASQPPTLQAPDADAQPLIILPLDQPFQTRGPRQEDIQGMVFHHTAGNSLDSALATNQSQGTGANYYITPDGQVYHATDNVMAHVQPRNATGSRNGNYPNLDSANTIGVELVAPNEAGVTDAQRAAARRLAQQLQQQYGFASTNIIGHGEIQGEGPLRILNPRAARQNDEGAVAATIRTALQGQTPPQTTPGFVPPSQSPPTLVADNQGNPRMGLLDEMFAPAAIPQSSAPPRRGQLPSGELTNPMEPTTSDVQMRGADQSPPQGGGGSWSEYLNNPDTRSFLISTGLQLMTGGWGNGLQQLGVAMGKGFEAQNANQIARSEDEQKAAERQNRSEIAAAGNTSREQVAAARNDATILRASIAAGAKTPAEQSMFQRDVNTFLQRLQSDVTNVGKPVEELMPRAVEMARQQMELRRVLGGEYGGGNAPQGQNGVSSSGVSPGVSPVVASVPPTQTPTGGQVAPSGQIKPPHEYLQQLPAWLRSMFGPRMPAPPSGSYGP